MLNETTIEGHSPEFQVGLRRNWMQVMGKDPLLWFLPVWGGGPDGDGIHWPSPLVSGHAAAGRGRGAHEQIEEGRLLESGQSESDGE